jgi:hypothetical protein
VGPPWAQHARLHCGWCERDDVSVSQKVVHLWLVPAIEPLHHPDAVVVAEFSQPTPVLQPLRYPDGAGARGGLHHPGPDGWLGE